MFYIITKQFEIAYARVVELADSLDSGSSVHYARAGSSPASRTKSIYESRCFFLCSCSLHFKLIPLHGRVRRQKRRLASVQGDFLRFGEKILRGYYAASILFFRGGYDMMVLPNQLNHA